MEFTFVPLYKNKLFFLYCPRFPGEIYEGKPISQNTAAVVQTLPKAPPEESDPGCTVDLYWQSFQICIGLEETYKLNLCRIWSSHSGGYEEFCLLGYNAM
jgi:hypothetical protein